MKSCSVKIRDKYNDSKTHCFREDAGGIVWYNQEINGLLFYDEWVWASRTGYWGLWLDYQEEMELSMLDVGDAVTVYRNQGEREGEVIAVLGDEALVIYEMPSGVEYMNIVSRRNPDDYRAISSKALPKKWKNLV